MDSIVAADRFRSSTSRLPAVRLELLMPEGQGPRLDCAIRLWVKPSWFEQSGLKDRETGETAFVRLDGSALNIRHVPRPGSDFSLLGQTLGLDHRAGPQLVVNATVTLLSTACCTLVGRIKDGFIRLDAPQQAMQNARSFLDGLWPGRAKSREDISALIVGRSGLQIEVDDQDPESDRRTRRLQFLAQTHPDTGGRGRLWQQVACPDNTNIEDPDSRLQQVIEYEALKDREVLDIDFSRRPTSGGLFFHYLIGQEQPAESFTRPGIDLVLPSGARWTPGTLREVSYSDQPDAPRYWQFSDVDEVGILMRSGRVVQVKQDLSVVDVAVRFEQDRSEILKLPALYLTATEPAVPAGQDYSWGIVQPSTMPGSPDHGLDSLPPCWVRWRVGGVARAPFDGDAQGQRLTGLDAALRFPQTSGENIEALRGWNLTFDLPANPQTVHQEASPLRLRATLFPGDEETGERARCLLEMVGVDVRAESPARVTLYDAAPSLPDPAAVPFEKDLHEDGKLSGPVSFVFRNASPPRDAGWTTGALDATVSQYAGSLRSLRVDPGPLQLPNPTRWLVAVKPQNTEVHQVRVIEEAAQGDAESVWTLVLDRPLLQPVTGDEVVTIQVLRANDQRALQMTLLFATDPSVLLQAPPGGVRLFPPAADALIDPAPVTGNNRVAEQQTVQDTPARVLPRDPNHGLVALSVSTCHLDWDGGEPLGTLTFDAAAVNVSGTPAVMALMPQVERSGPSADQDPSYHRDWLRAVSRALHHRNLVQEHAEVEAAARDRAVAPGASTDLPVLPAAAFIRATRDRYTQASANLLDPTSGEPRTVLDPNTGNPVPRPTRLLNWLPGVEWRDAQGRTLYVCVSYHDGDDEYPRVDATWATGNDCTGPVPEPRTQTLSIAAPAHHWLTYRAEDIRLDQGEAPSARIGSPDAGNGASTLLSASSAPLLFDSPEIHALAATRLGTGLRLLFANGRGQVYVGDPADSFDAETWDSWQHEGGPVVAADLRGDDGQWWAATADRSGALQLHHHDGASQIIDANSATALALFKVESTVWLLVGSNTGGLTLYSSDGDDSSVDAPPHRDRIRSVRTARVGDRWWILTADETGKVALWSVAADSNPPALESPEIISEGSAAIIATATGTLDGGELVLAIATYDPASSTSQIELRSRAGGTGSVQATLRISGEVLSLAFTRADGLETSPVFGATDLFLAVATKDGLSLYPRSSLGEKILWRKQQRLFWRPNRGELRGLCHAPSFADHGDQVQPGPLFCGSSTGHVDAVDPATGDPWQSVEPLSSPTPRYLDNLGILRPTRIASANADGWRIETLTDFGPTQHSREKRTVYSVSYPGNPLLVQSGTTHAPLQIGFACDALKVDASGQPLLPYRAGPADSPLDQGVYAFFSNITAHANANSALRLADHWPRLYGVPFLARLSRFTIDTSTGSPQITGLECDAVLANPDDFAGDLHESDAAPEREPDFGPDAALFRLVIDLTTNPASVSLDPATKHVGWTFRRDVTTSDADIPARLARLYGTLRIDNDQLKLSPSDVRVSAFGQEWNAEPPGELTASNEFHEALDPQQVRFGFLSSEESPDFAVDSESGLIGTLEVHLTLNHQLPPNQHRLADRATLAATLQTDRLSLRLLLDGESEPRPLAFKRRQGPFLCFTVAGGNDSEQQALLLWLESTASPVADGGPLLGALWYVESIDSSATGQVTGLFDAQGPRLLMHAYASRVSGNAVEWVEQRFVSWYLTGPQGSRSLELHIGDQPLLVRDTTEDPHYPLTARLVWREDGRTEVQATVRLNVYADLDDAGATWTFELDPALFLMQAVAPLDDQAHPRPHLAYPVARGATAAFYLRETRPADGQPGFAGLRFADGRLQVVNLPAGQQPPIDICLDPDRVAPVPRAPRAVTRLTHRRGLGILSRAFLDPGPRGASDAPHHDFLFEELFPSPPDEAVEVPDNDGLWLFSPVVVIGGREMSILRDSQALFPPGGDNASGLSTEDVLILQRPDTATDSGAPGLVKNLLAETASGNAFSCDDAGRGTGNLLSDEQISAAVLEAGADGVVMHRALLGDALQPLCFKASPLHAESLIDPAPQLDNTRAGRTPLSPPPNASPWPGLDHRLRLPRQWWGRIELTSATGYYSVAAPTDDPLSRVKCAPMRGFRFERHEGQPDGDVGGVVPHLCLLEATAFRHMAPLWHDPGTPPRADDARLFRPRQLEIDYPADKPGAVFHHSLRGLVAPLSGERWDVEPGVDFAVREPQPTQVIGCAVGAIDLTGAAAAGVGNGALDAFRRITLHWNELLGSASLARDMSTVLQVIKRGDRYLLDKPPAQWCIRFNDDVFVLTSNDFTIPVYVTGEAPDPTRPENVGPPDIRMVTATDSPNLDAGYDPGNGAAAVPFRAIISARRNPLQPVEVVSATGGNGPSAEIRLNVNTTSYPERLPEENAWVAVVGITDPHEAVVLDQANSVAQVRWDGDTLILTGIESAAGSISPEDGKLFVLSHTAHAWRVNEVFDAVNEPTNDRYLRPLASGSPITWHQTSDPADRTNLQLSWYGVVKNGEQFELQTIDLFEQRKELKYLSPAQLRPKLAFVLRVSDGDDGYHLQRTILFGDSAPSERAIARVDRTGTPGQYRYRFVVEVNDNQDEVTVPFNALDDAKVVAVKYLPDGRTLVDSRSLE